MKQTTSQKNALGRFALLMLGAVSLVSCGSFEYASYDDGVYGGSTQIAQEEQPTAQQATYYSSYFNQGADQLQQANEQAEVFTDIDSYSSTGEYDEEAIAQDVNLGYTGQPAWGATWDRTIVNIYPSNFGGGFGYGNFGFSPFYGGWGNPYGYGYGYGSGFGYSPFFNYGYPYWGHSPYFYGGFGYPYGGYAYGGYGYGNRGHYNNGYYNDYRRNYAYSRSARTEGNISRRSNTSADRSNVSRRSSRSSTAQSGYTPTRRTYSRNNVGVDPGSRSSRSAGNNVSRSSSRSSIYNSNSAQRRSSSSRTQSYTPSRSSTNRSSSSRSYTPSTRSSSPNISRSAPTRSSGNSASRSSGSRSSGGVSRSSGGSSRRGGGR